MPNAQDQYPRAVFHPHNENRKGSTVQIFVPVDDNVYKDRFDYEALDVEPVRRGLSKAFVITCVPFLVYGLNRGDVVSSKKGLIQEKLKDGGQFGYRIAYRGFVSDEDAHNTIEPILSHLRDRGFQTEEFNHKISAVNAETRDLAISLEEILKQLIAEKKITEYDTIR